MTTQSELEYQFTIEDEGDISGYLGMLLLPGFQASGSVAASRTSRKRKDPPRSHLILNCVSTIPTNSLADASFAKVGHQGR